MNFNDYKEVTYRQFQSKFIRAFKSQSKTYMQVAVEINVRTHVTVINAFNEEEQKVSDKVLTAVMKSIGMDGFTLHKDGQRKYYLNN